MSLRQQNKLEGWVALPRLQGWWQAGRAGRRNHPRPLEAALFHCSTTPGGSWGSLSHPRQERQRHSSDAMEVGAKADSLPAARTLSPAVVPRVPAVP